MTSSTSLGETTAGRAVTAPAPLSPRQRAWTTLFLMSGAIMNMVDTTIANVALPQMQGTTATSREEITWVLTSFVISMAIFTPVVGWLTTRWSRKTVLVTTLTLFTLFSVLCAMSTTVEELVLFRILQGMSGAATVPLTQTTMLDIYPREEHGKAMAIFGLASVAGPLLGPLLGGWLTSNFSWGWVFLVNLPIGAMAVIGLATVLPKSANRPPLKFDLVSYALFATTIAAVQLIADRGLILDWFDSTEICIEVLAGVTAFAGFVWVSAHRARPFISPAILRDRSFVAATSTAVIGGGITLGTMALLPELLAQYYGYSAQQIGLLIAPRGFATLAMTPVVPLLMRRFGNLRMMIAGTVLMSLASLQLSTLTLEGGASTVAVSGIVQGIGGSLFWTPMTLMAYSTIAGSLRDEAASLHMLARTLATSLGISVLQTITLHDAIIVHADLAGIVRMENLPPILQDLASHGATAQMAAMVNAEVTRQAGMMAYIDSFRGMFVAQLATLLLFPLLRTSRTKSPQPAPPKPRQATA